MSEMTVSGSSSSPSAVMSARVGYVELSKFDTLLETARTDRPSSRPTVYVINAVPDLRAEIRPFMSQLAALFKPVAATSAAGSGAQGGVTLDHP